MHILQINTEKGWRGGERQTLLSMEGLRDAGIEVTLLCLRGRPLWERAKAAGFRVVGVGGQPGALLHIICSGRRYSVVHAQSSRAFGFAAIATLFLSVPLVYTRRVDFVPRGALTRWKYRRASALVAVSDAIRKILSNAGMGQAKVIGDIVADHSCDSEYAKSIKREFAPDGDRIVGVVAALVDHKDPLTMIRAASIVCERLPGTVFLHFGDGDLMAAAREERCRLGLENAYVLAGFRDRVEDCFAVFDCFAMSSCEEGLGSSVLDAYNSGVPVASTSAGGLRELVDGRGLLSPPREPALLAENIIRLLSDPQLADALSGAARRYVGEYHNRARLTAEYVRIYRTLHGDVTP